MSFIDRVTDRYLQDPILLNIKKHNHLVSAIQAQDKPPIILADTTQIYCAEVGTSISGILSAVDRDGEAIKRWSLIHPPRRGTFTLNSSSGEWTFLSEVDHEFTFNVVVGCIDPYNRMTCIPLTIAIYKKLPFIPSIGMSCYIKQSHHVSVNIPTLYGTTMQSSVKIAPFYGSVILHDDHSFTYIQDKPPRGNDSFSILVTDSRDVQRSYNVSVRILEEGITP